MFRQTSESSRIRFSLVIPARNEEKYLPRVLETVRVAVGRYRGGPGESREVEVIVADNASTDRTAEIAREFGARVVAVEKRAIGAVRNGGARVARGEYLCFADADNPLHPETFNEIDRVLARPRVAGGATGCVPEKWSVGMAAIYFIVYLPIVVLMRIDGGVVFCRREDWEAVGGYDEEWLVSEDVRFLAALRRHVRARGDRLARASRAKAVISNRRFDLWGQGHMLAQAWRMSWRWMARDRAGVDELARAYWYSDKR